MEVEWSLPTYLPTYLPTSVTIAREPTYLPVYQSTSLPVYQSKAWTSTYVPPSISGIYSLVKQGGGGGQGGGGPGGGGHSLHMQAVPHHGQAHGQAHAHAHHLPLTVSTGDRTLQRVTRAAPVEDMKEREMAARAGGGLAALFGVRPTQQMHSHRLADGPHLLPDLDQHGHQQQHRLTDLALRTHHELNGSITATFGCAPSLPCGRYSLLIEGRVADGTAVCHRELPFRIAPRVWVSTLQCEHVGVQVGWVGGASVTIA